MHKIWILVAITSWSIQCLKLDIQNMFGYYMTLEPLVQKRSHFNINVFCHMSIKDITDAHGNVIPQVLLNLL